MRKEQSLFDLLSSDEKLLAGVNDAHREIVNIIAETDNYGCMVLTLHYSPQGGGVRMYKAQLRAFDSPVPTYHPGRKS